MKVVQPASSPPSGRTSSMKRLLLAGGTAATTFIFSAQTALGANTGPTEKTPLDLPLESTKQQATSGGSSGGGLGRTLIGLLVVCAIIYGLYWLLKQVKKSREQQASGSGLHSLATLPLGPNRSLHMIRAGREIVLIGVAEHGVAPIRSYSEEEAYAAGLIGDDDDDPTAAGPGAGQKFATPGQGIGSALKALRERTVRR
jgi:flagellar protein FliO/FliZ